MEVRVISDVGSEELTELSSTPPARASQEKTEASSPKGPEKKVRFSDDLIKGSHETHTVGDQNSACLETKGDSSFKNTSSSTVSQKLEERQHAPIDTQGAGSTQDQVDIHAGDAQPQSSSTRPGQQLQAPEVSTAFKTECAESRQHDNVVTPSSSSHMEEKASGPQQENSVQLLEHTKSNSNSNRNTEELLDSSLSVLNMEEETCPALTTSTDKARENGKIVWRYFMIEISQSESNGNRNMEHLPQAVLVDAALSFSGSLNMTCVYKRLSALALQLCIYSWERSF